MFGVRVSGEGGGQPALVHVRPSSHSSMSAQLGLRDIFIEQELPAFYAFCAFLCVVTVTVTVTGYLF